MSSSSQHVSCTFEEALFRVWQTSWSLKHHISFFLSRSTDSGLPKFLSGDFHFIFDSRCVSMYRFGLNLGPHFQQHEKSKLASSPLVGLVPKADIFRVEIMWADPITSGSSVFQTSAYKHCLLLDLVSKWLLILQSIPFQLGSNPWMPPFFPTRKKVSTHIESVHPIESLAL